MFVVDFNIRLPTRVQPREQEVVVCGQNFNWTKSKTMQRNVDACMTLRVKCTVRRGKGSPRQPPLNAPKLFRFRRNQQVAIIATFPTIQEPSLRSEKLIGIRFAESECSEKLRYLRIWVHHKTCRAAELQFIGVCNAANHCGAPPT